MVLTLLLLLLLQAFVVLNEEAIAEIINVLVVVTMLLLLLLLMISTKCDVSFVLVLSHRVLVVWMVMISSLLLLFGFNNDGNDYTVATSIVL